MPKTYTVPPPPHHNEGKTVAAWTMSLGIVVGATVICAGMVLAEMSVLLWIGAGIIALALLVGIVLSVAGLGQPRSYGEIAERSAATATAHETARAQQPAEAEAR